MTDAAGARRFRRTALTTLLLAATLIYLPIAGHGLRTDDFSRIRDNAGPWPGYLGTLLTDMKSDGFYRPLNHLTFGLTWQLGGLHPYPYGLFNFLVLLATCWVLFRIVEERTGDPAFGLLLGIAWLANVKTISTMVTWAVGRTTGLYTLFLLLAVLAASRARQVPSRIPLAAACAWTGLALLSKESAIVAAPFVLAAHGRERPARLAALAGGLSAVYAVYFWFRLRAQAMGPFDAPPYYRFDLSPAGLIDHLLTYLERSVVFGGLAVASFWIVTRPGTGNREPQRRTRTRVIGWLAGFLIALSPMLAIPSPSSLYAYLPGLFVLGLLVDLCRGSSRWQSSNRHRIVLAACVVASIAMPIAWVRGYATYQRNRHTLEWSRTIADVLEAAPASAVVLRPDPAWTPRGTDLEAERRFVQTALELRGHAVELIVDSAGTDREAPVFELVPAPDSRRVGVLRPGPP